MFQKAKKTISIVLAVILLLSLFSSVSFAATDPEWKYDYEIENGKVIITRFRNAGAEITIPTTLDGAPVTAVRLSVFDDYSRLQTITVAPDHPYFTTVDGVLFDKNMTTLLIYPKAKQGVYTVPDGVKTIQNEAFTVCKGLTEVYLPDSVIAIGDDAFSYCDNLASIHLPDSITSIGFDAFCSCTRLTEIHIPVGLTVIEDCAFRYCTALK